jgi:peptidyl-prolyl cis-trans isomerase C
MPSPKAAASKGVDEENGMTARSWVVATCMSAAVFVPRAAAQAPKANGPVAAVVNGEPIPMAELDAIVQAVPQASSPPAPAQQRQLRADALELLIDDVLIRQYLAAHAPKIDPADCDKELAMLTASLKARSMSLADFLRESKQTEEQLRLEVVKKLQWERYIKQHVTDAVLRRHYEENRDFYDRVTVQASHILFRLSPSAPATERNQVAAKLRDLRAKIVGGQIDFAEAARKYSQCQSAARGGDIGFFSRKWAVDERVAKAAFALAVGEVSDIVETDYGLHLLKVTARKPGKPSTFETVKDEVRKNYTMELWHEVIGKQRKTAKIDNKLS